MQDLKKHKLLHPYRNFVGDPVAIKYAARDLPTLRAARELCVNTRSALQAGGNAGVFADYLSGEFDDVYVFEPAASTFRDMAQNMRLTMNVHMMQAALGDERGCVGVSRERRRKVQVPPHDGVTHVSGRGTVPRLRIDDLALEVLDLLVLDLEGYELWALQGAGYTVERCRPVIMVEINENCHFEGVREDDIRTWLRTNDYQFRFREHSDEVWTWGR